MWTQIRLLLEEQSDQGPQFAEMIFKSQADDKADDNCCDWQFKVKKIKKIILKDPSGSCTMINP